MMDAKQKLVRQLEDIGRIRLSPNFFSRDFLHSEIAAVYGIINLPDDGELSVGVKVRYSHVTSPLARMAKGNVPLGN
jgi:hypothetical protein